MSHIRAGGAILFAALLTSTTAHATTFVVSLRNTSIETWSEGLLAPTQLFTASPTSGVNPVRTPQPGSNEYYTFAFVGGDCDLSDGFCASPGCDDDANATVLAQRWGLTVGTNAWVIPQINGATQLSATSYAGCTSDAACGGTGVRCVAGRPSGLSAAITWTGGVCQFDVTFQATPSQRLSYVAKVLNGRTNDFVAITPFLDPNTHTLQLYASSGPNVGLPLDTLSPGYAGYNFNSTSATNGTLNACAPGCPVNPAAGCFVARRQRTTDGVVPDSPSRPTLTQLWTHVATGFTTDGIAVGDVMTGGGQEVVVLANGGNYLAPPYAVAPGRMLVLSLATGAIREGYTATSGNDLMGFPMIEPLYGIFTPCVSGSPCHITFGETGDVAPPTGTAGGVLSRAFDLGTASWQALWTSRPFGFPGHWNMGPSAGNVRTDVSVANGTQNPLQNEVVIADLYGNISVLRANDANVLNTYNTYTAHNRESVFGHAALANIDADPSLEIVVMGARAGRVIAVRPGTTSGLMTAAYVSDPLPTPGRATANGPAIGDIDGDGNPEIIVVAGNLDDVYAYDARFGTGCKYRWRSLGGTGYNYTSPVIGDVTGDGRREVVVFSNDSVLSVLSAPATPGVGCTDGTITWEYTVGNGGNSWFTPALGNMAGNTKLDVAVANYNTVEVIDVDARRPEFRFSAGTASFYPSVAIQGGTTGGQGAFLHLSGWGNSTVYRLATPFNQPFPSPWLSFMGGNTRTGAR
ncbi:VCBS repeat-containing protein [Myxococcota bacterium]|nr:VCBS repeat-containing protein [Myxococcota bacterium]